MELSQITFDLPLFYFLILGFAIFMYVLLDGFDLGIGILFPWFESKAEKDHLMRSISHVWDGNETWLIFGGVILFAAFPAAYAALTSTFYLPIMIMLFALIFRGVAFEYRFKSDRSKPWWDFAFSTGSTVAAFCQGMILGAVVQGIPAGVNIAEASMASSWIWVTPFSVMTGFAVMTGYALLAAGYLYMKSRDALQIKAAKYGRRLLVALLFFMMAVSIWTVIDQVEIRQRWLSGLNFLWLSPLPILSILLACVAWQRFDTRNADSDLHEKHVHENWPFWCAAGLFLLGFAGLLVGLFPYLIPRQMTLWSAAAPDSSLQFLMFGIVIFLPLICAYTLWGYRVFSGKIEDYQEGY